MLIQSLFVLLLIFYLFKVSLSFRKKILLNIDFFTVYVRV